MFELQIVIVGCLLNFVAYMMLSLSLQVLHAITNTVESNFRTSHHGYFHLAREIAYAVTFLSP